jgi:hypothetical protein
MTDGRAAVYGLVKHSNPFRLPSGRRNLDFDIEVSGVEVIRDSSLATSMGDLANAGASTGTSKINELLKAASTS